MIRRLLLIAFLAWCLALAIVFVMSAVIPAWPAWFELPWSGFEDFVVTAGGDVVVYSAVFHQLLVYNVEGAFRASLAVPRSRGEHRLATDVDGRVFIQRGPIVYVAASLDPDVYQLARFQDAAFLERGWMLGEDGNPRAIPPDVPWMERGDRAVGRGGVLFSAVRGERRRFEMTSGGEVNRIGDRLLLRDAAGRRTTLGTPWYLYWLKFPLPGAAAWIMAIVLGVFEARVRPWLEGRRGPR